jgi:hypothetical protein
MKLFVWERLRQLWREPHFREFFQDSADVQRTLQAVDVARVRAMVWCLLSVAACAALDTKSFHQQCILHSLHLSSSLAVAVEYDVHVWLVAMCLVRLALPTVQAPFPISCHGRSTQAGVCMLSRYVADCRQELMNRHRPPPQQQQQPLLLSKMTGLAMECGLQLVMASNGGCQSRQ